MTRAERVVEEDAIETRCVIGAYCRDFSNEVVLRTVGSSGWEE
jgi:hypothetical protein